MSIIEIPLRPIIEYMEQTAEDSWCTDVVRHEDKNCFFGHLHQMYAQGQGLGPGAAWSWFEELHATTYMLYPVNDGEHPGYPQSTPKQRVIAYLLDLESGKELNTQQTGNLEYEKWKSQNPEKALP